MSAVPPNKPTEASATTHAHVSLKEAALEASNKELKAANAQLQLRTQTLEAKVKELETRLTGCETSKKRVGDEMDDTGRSKRSRADGGDTNDDFFSWSLALDPLPPWVKRANQGGIFRRQVTTPPKPNRPAKPVLTALTGNECAWCMKRNQGLVYASTHRLHSCVWPTGLGDIPGCPLCNTLEHSWDACPIAHHPNWSNEQRQASAYNFLVRYRGSMPPIRTTTSWPALADQRTTGQPLRDGYPVTKAFVLEKFKSNRQWLARYHEHARLPFLEDPATASIADIRQNLGALNITEVYLPVAGERCPDMHIPTNLAGDGAEA